MNKEIVKNIDTEIEMLREISDLSRKASSLDNVEKEFLEKAINSLKRGMKIINKSIPKILEGYRGNKPLKIDSIKKNLNLEVVVFNGMGPSVNVVLDRGDKSRFLKELSISEQFIKKLKKKRGEEVEVFQEYQRSRGYMKMANKYFLNYGSKLVKQGNFKDLSVDIKKSNFDILFESYIALMLFTTLISFLLSIILFVFLMFFSINLSWPIVSMINGGYLARLGKVFWVPLVVPILTFIGFYIYPSTERKSIEGRINQELPFAVIHMSAISGSGIAPSEIFRIIGLNKEYPYLRKEIRKILNQINLYGYDLVTSLNNASKSAPSEKLAELFSGLSTTITSGADLAEFFQKRAESLMLNYRLERERYTKVVETFLDIYISIVIAAPMIFLLLLVMMLISGINIGISSLEISLISVAGVAVLNVFFLIFLQLKQPTY